MLTDLPTYEQATTLKTAQDCAKYVRRVLDSGLQENVKHSFIHDGCYAVATTTIKVLFPYDNTLREVAYGKCAAAIQQPFHQPESVALLANEDNLLKLIHVAIGEACIARYRVKNTAIPPEAIFDILKVMCEKAMPETDSARKIRTVLQNPDAMSVLLGGMMPDIQERQPRHRHSNTRRKIVPSISVFDALRDDINAVLIKHGCEPLQDAKTASSMTR